MNDKVKTGLKGYGVMGLWAYGLTCLYAYMLRAYRHSVFHSLFVQLATKEAYL